jgi:putative two-component system response regulator
VLLVGEDPGTARLLATSVVAAGHDLVTAPDAAAALRLLPTQRFDVIVSTLALPDTDAIELCRSIKEAPATQDIAVILLADADDPRERARALEAGADDFVVRPLDGAVVLALVNARLRIRRLHNQLNDLEGIVLSLARALDDREASSGRSERIAHWATQLGSAIGLSEAEITELYKAALLRDVGAVAVPAAILSKRGPLEPAEFSQVKRHPEIGEQLLHPLPAADRVLPAVRHHHERIDGNGYPDGLSGEGIPLFARILAIADAFVALTSDRPYRARLSRAQALDVLRRESGRQWDKVLVDRFIALVEEAQIRATEIESAG